MAKSMPRRAQLSMRECATLLPSPQKDSFRPARSPKRSFSVSTSASTWQGWYKSLSALMTGTEDQRASSSMVSCEKVRATMACTQRSRLRATSLSGSRAPMGPPVETQAPPRCLIARAQGSLFEEQADVLALEGAGIVAGRLLHIEGDIEQAGQLVVGEVEVAAEVGGRDSSGLLTGDGESGHGGTSL